jgi:hypothetical protein
MEKLSWTLRAENFDVVGFYPYTTVVQNRLFEILHRDAEAQPVLVKFVNEMWEKAEALNCIADNKMAIEVRPNNVKGDTTSTLYIGWYDGVISIGLSIWQPDAITKNYNKTFSKE